ncbi:MAG: RNA polymerase sigma factor [Rikenellaceae bacterium]
MSDRELLNIIGCPARREEGFALLSVLYREPIYWHIRRLVVSAEDAEDLLQETLVKVFLNIDRFERRSSLRSWIYKIATNECHHHFRSRRRWFVLGGDSSEELLSRLEAEAELPADSIEVRLQRAILKLPTRQREIFSLRYYDEMSYDEIAQILGGKISALKSNYHYARAKIEREMVENE